MDEALNIPSKQVLDAVFLRTSQARVCLKSRLGLSLSFIVPPLRIGIDRRVNRL